jgi:glycerate 2-kinase
VSVRRRGEGLRILIAPDSFKESLAAAAVADALEKGLRRVLRGARIEKLPMADGGEGTVDAVVRASGGRLLRRSVTGPLGEPVRAAFGLLPDGSAVIEMAAASGLPLVPLARRDPRHTTTYGTGELIAHALKLGASRIVVGLGGSATNDAGAGMAQALGAVFRDRRGRVLERPLTGGELGTVVAAELGAMALPRAGIEVIAASDVRNPLCGPRGAAAIFGPQKGADPALIRQLDRKLHDFAEVIEGLTRRGLSLRPGAGAAGGLGFGLMAFARARLMPGAPLIMQLLGVESRLRETDLLITAEGRIDGQTVLGKAPAALARLARRLDVPVVGVGGALAADAASLFRHGFDALEAGVTRPTELSRALFDARVNLERAGERIGHWLLLGQRLERH